ncbi:hypothetical protein [Magnetovibrio sp.]|uniref:hypothetical protein n=1 Tax=Magnetovibrio sp. TaxID=2024836 RepID=UPI002F943479
MLVRVLSIALTCCVAISGSALARDDASLTVADSLSTAPQSRVIDIRDETSCLAGSLPQARCLPVGFFISPTGKVIDFHALRWLLGTVGLTGGESVLVVAANADDAHAVGTLLHRAGQRHVAAYDKPFHAPANASSGSPRSLSRETVFTAPMRDDADRK